MSDPMHRALMEWPRKFRVLLSGIRDECAQQHVNRVVPQGGLHVVPCYWSALYAQPVFLCDGFDPLAVKSLGLVPFCSAVIYGRWDGLDDRGPVQASDAQDAS